MIGPSLAIDHDTIIVTDWLRSIYGNYHPAFVNLLSEVAGNTYTPESLADFIGRQFQRYVDSFAGDTPDARGLRDSLHLSRNSLVAQAAYALCAPIGTSQFLELAMAQLIPRESDRLAAYHGLALLPK